MTRVRFAALVAMTAGAVALLQAQNAPPIHRQPGATIDARVADLLGRMTLDGRWPSCRRSGTGSRATPILTAVLEVAAR